MTSTGRILLLVFIDKNWVLEEFCFWFYWQEFVSRPWKIFWEHVCFMSLRTGYDIIVPISMYSSLVNPYTYTNACYSFLAIQLIRGNVTFSCFPLSYMNNVFSLHTVMIINFKRNIRWLFPYLKYCCKLGPLICVHLWIFGLMTGDFWQNA